MDARVRQDSFFLVDLVSVQLKELVQHMEHPFFGLSRTPDKKRIVRRYEDGHGSYIEIRADAELGFPTIFDQDLLIYATSVLIAERERLQANPHRREARRTVQGEGIVEFSTADFAEFSGRVLDRRTAGSQYASIAQGLRRLFRTGIETNIRGGGLVQTKFFGIVDEAGMTRREQAAPDQEEILLGCQLRLSRWMLAAIEKNEILTLSRDYFRLRRPLDRRIYQIVRKHCGNQPTWEVSLPKLYAKSGALSPLKNFRLRYREFVDRWHQEIGNPDSDVESFLGYLPHYDPARDVARFTQARRPETIATLEAARSLPRSGAADLLEVVRQEAPGWDPDGIYAAWLDWSAGQDTKPRNPKAALRGFVRKWLENKPILVHDPAGGLTLGRRI